jgi:predicted RNA binding protein YcfA (HicA-like mRNA interferase family)
MSRREMRQLMRRVEKQGFTTENTNGGHVKITSPDGKPIFASSSPSDGRAIKNLISQLRRLGYVHNDR